MKGASKFVLGLVLLSFLCAVAVGENYPHFEFVQQQQDQSSTTAVSQSSSNVQNVAVPEPKTATEFAKMKPNNYPNFEFRTEDVKQSSSNAVTTTSSFQSVPENKPNNYPNFEFKESNTAKASYDSLFGQEQTAHRTTTTTTPGSTVYRGSDASGRYPSSFDLTNARHQTEVRGASTTEAAGSQFTSTRDNIFSTSSSEDKTSTTSPKYRGSDPYARNPSSFDLTNSRYQEAQPQSQTQQFSTRDSFTTNTQPASTSSSTLYRGSDASGRYPSSFDLTNARYQTSHSQQDATGSQYFSTQNSIPHESSVSTHRSSDTSGMYPSSFDLTNARQQASYVYNAEQASRSTNQFTTSGKVFGDESSAYRFNGGSKYSTEQVAADQTTSFGTFNHDTREFTSGDLKTSFGTTTPAADSSSQSRPSSIPTAGKGCSSSYWTSHTGNWPSFFTINSKVTDAFPGSKVAIVYGTTTLLQALYDTRPDGYSQLLSHGVAALLNAYEKPSSYEYSHTAVIELFTNALASRTSAAQQALKFQNANTAYGTEGCDA
jgi:hypothetical protein